MLLWREYKRTKGGQHLVCLYIRRISRKISRRSWESKDISSYSAGITNFFASGVGSTATGTPQLSPVRYAVTLSELSGYERTLPHIRLIYSSISQRGF
ncbi:hypothetical protein TNCT_333671 [Trichonephila clavata]|uniref:Uncharacterized protein n=1 Tax=Trichonephila clavata TaxID=2740835 RepID=A0A8X6LIP4_TRICU|nr:hypothetical protein TNCT_333671 [Trichonephila clavata]